MIKYVKYWNRDLDRTEAALATIRRHQLLEIFLVSELSYTWDKVHDEVEVFEHTVSDRLVKRIDPS